MAARNNYLKKYVINLSNIHSDLFTKSNQKHVLAKTYLVHALEIYLFKIKRHLQCNQKYRMIHRDRL